MLHLTNKNEISLDNFSRFDTNNWEELKSRITCKLTNTKVFEQTQDVENIIHEKFLDLTKTYVVTELSKDRKNVISYTLKHEDLERFGKTYNDLTTAVKYNYDNDIYKRIRRFKEEMLSHEVLYPLMVDTNNAMLQSANALIEDYSDENETDNILIITNKYNVFGASYMLNSKTLQEVYNRMNSNFYILPISIHQLMCVSNKYVTKNKDAYEAEDDLLDMLFTMNQEIKNAENILSYQIYQYIGDDGIKIFPIKQRL